MVHLHVHMSFAIAGAPLAAPSVSTHCHVSFTAFSACDSIHKHPCLTLVICPRMFAIRPPLSRYPQHSALLRGFDHAFGLSFALRPQVPYTLYQPCSNLRSQHRLLTLTTTNARNQKGIAGMRSSTTNKWLIRPKHFGWYSKGATVASCKKQAGRSRS